MSRAATRLVWDLAGRPSPSAASVARLIERVPGACAICGEPAEETASFDKALGQNFVDRSLIRSVSSRVCPACLWCSSGRPPATLRMWTVVAAQGVALPASQPKAFVQDTPGLCLTSRADTRPVIDVLSSPPLGSWCVSVAMSGQKHVLPYASLNRGSGAWSVRVEDHDVAASPWQWNGVFAAALGLRRIGVPADAIRVGEPRFVRDAHTLKKWRVLDARLAGWHGSPLLDLALWTITKGIIENEQYR